MTNLDELISKITAKHVYIQTHNFPDPDALGSGFCLQYLLRLYGIESTICYGGTIDRFNTQKMIELFGIDAYDITDLKDRKKDDETILVDTQNVPGNVELTGYNVIACIDHHMLFFEQEYRFCDIREDVGACASILASYFKENNIEIPKNVAEVILYAINMDTANLTRGVSNLDLDVFYNLYMISDREKINYLENNAIQIDDLPKYVEVINSLYISHNVSFADAGWNCSKSLVAIISDFTSKIESIYFSVIYCRNDGGIRMSVRSIKKEIHSGKLINEVLNGIGQGGGHHCMAGGFVPLEKGYTEEDVRRVVSIIEKKIVMAVKKCR